MSLDYQYDINTGNRFLSLVDHDEDPDEFISEQTKPDEKVKKSTKEVKTTTKKTTNKQSITAPTPATTTTSSAKTNKENLTTKSASAEQKRQPTAALADNNQQPRGDSARGGGRGFSGRGGSAGYDRPPYEGGGRPPRTPRYNKFDRRSGPGETGGFEQNADAWTNEPGNDNQPSGGYRGRGRGGRGRGGFDEGRRFHEGGRGGRGRGRGGRGQFHNQNSTEGAQQPSQHQENSSWDQAADSGFEKTQAPSTGAAEKEFEHEPENVRGNSRGYFRARTFRSNRHYGGDRSNYQSREEGGGQEESRQYRRQHDRQPRNYVSGVKAVEKKDGNGAHNYGNQIENFEENIVVDENPDATAEAPATKDWSQQVDEAEKQMTLDEYKKQQEEKKKQNQEKLPQFNRRSAGEGVDPQKWDQPSQIYQKKNDDDEEEAEELGSEDEESGEDVEGEQQIGKKKIINIPLQFNPVERPRDQAPFGFRGGPRRGGGGGRFRDRPNRSDQPRSYSPNRQQPYSTQPTGDQPTDERPQSGYRGGQRGGPRYVRTEYRRSYANSARGSRGGYNRTSADPNAPDIDNTTEFPTLPK